MKSINELTEKEAEEILEFVYPEGNAYFDKIDFEPVTTGDGKMQLTFGMRPIVGISYRNDNLDRCILHFDHSKVVLWLYKHGYDITEQLEYNKEFSSTERDLENLCDDIHWSLDYSKKEWTLESFKEYMIELTNKYYYDTEY